MHCTISLGTLIVPLKRHLRGVSQAEEQARRQDTQGVIAAKQNCRDGNKAPSADHILDKHIQVGDGEVGAGQSAAQAAYHNRNVLRPLYQDAHDKGRSRIFTCRHNMQAELCAEEQIIGRSRDNDCKQC